MFHDSIFKSMIPSISILSYYHHRLTALTSTKRTMEWDAGYRLRKAIFSNCTLQHCYFSSHKHFTTFRKPSHRNSPQFFGVTNFRSVYLRTLPRTLRFSSDGPLQPPQLSEFRKDLLPLNNINLLLNRTRRKKSAHRSESIHVRSISREVGAGGIDS